MKSTPSFAASASKKTPSGIVGFDELTGGGLPHGRSTLLAGGAGSGKTIFALQFLVHGARDFKEPGIFVAFEESRKRIVANLQGFNWNIAGLLAKNKLFFLDAQPAPDLVQAGDFDLSGLLAVSGAQAKAMGARRIVFDALDIVMALLPFLQGDGPLKWSEILRANDWPWIKMLGALALLAVGSALTRAP